MAITLIAVGETRPYRIPSDQEADPENATVWQLRILDSLARYRLADAIRKATPKESERLKRFREATRHLADLQERAEKDKSDTLADAKKEFDEAFSALTDEDTITSDEYFDALLDACRFGIAGWSFKEPEFKTRTEERWGHSYDVVTDDLLLRIPNEHVPILAYAVMNENFLSAAEKKVSGSPGEQES